MADYTDPVQMIQDIQYHVRLTGHRLIAGDDPRRSMFGWVCSTCGDSWHISGREFLELGGRFWGLDLSRSQILSYLNGDLEPPARIPQGNSLLYRDPIEMVRDIRSHVLLEDHRVECSDNPLGQTLGYTCFQCAKDDSRVPRVSTWYVGLLALKSLTVWGREADLLRGSLTGALARGKLTDYLNRREVRSPVLTRYKRPWVV